MATPTRSVRLTFRNEVDAFVVFLEQNLSTAQNWNRVNVIRMDVESDQSGADNTQCNQSAQVDTYFDARFCTAGLDRTLEVDESLVIQTANANFPEWDALLVFVNITAYGGLGRGGVAVASLDPAWKWELALHEMGHAAFDLADEYDNWAGCDSGETDRNRYPSAQLGEPVERNVTATLSPLKWDVFVTPGTSIPTTSNPDCSECDPNPSPVSTGTVGAFEGARYFHCDAWRPQFRCRMNDLGDPWCAVCADRIDHVLNLVQCFVASAVYGDPFHADVTAIRRWRDDHLRPGDPVRAVMAVLVALYGRVGPIMARWVRPRDGIAKALRRYVFGPWAALVRRREEERP